MELPVITRKIHIKNEGPMRHTLKRYRSNKTVIPLPVSSVMPTVAIIEATADADPAEDP